MSTSDLKDFKIEKEHLMCVQEAEDAFEKVKGSKMMFLKGKLYKSNLSYLDNEKEYY